MQPAETRTWIQKIFVSEDETRLRAGWRLLLQTLFMVIIGNCLIIPLIVYIILGGAPTLDLNNPNISKEILLPLQLIETLMITSSIYLARRFLDKRSFGSLGVDLNPQALMDVMAGISIAFAIMGLIYAVESSLGWVKFEGFAWEADSAFMATSSTLIFGLIFILTGWSEELISRGYHLQNLTDGMGKFWGVMISSAIFGLAHITNPNATWIAALDIFLAGLFFAYAFLRTGALWLGIGLHIGWNFFEGVIFGFPVSGLDTYHLIWHQVQGPEIWTGGAFGPEAGLIVLPALAIGTVLIYLYTMKKNLLS